MRYLRQKSLVDQEKISKACVAVVGVGGLGNPASVYLAGLGVGKIILIDNDVIEKTNLNRQFLFSDRDVGTKKVVAAKKAIERFNPEVNVDTSETFNKKILLNADVILDCLDSWESRKKLWETAFSLGKPIIHGGTGKFSGQVAVMFSKEDAFSLENKKESEKLVIGPVAGMVGSRMALECLNIIEGLQAPKIVLFEKGVVNEYPLKSAGGKPEYTHTLVRFSEIWLKSPSTRNKMMGRLAGNICRAMKAKPEKEMARIVLRGVHDLSRIFGVKSFSPCFKVPNGRLESFFAEYSSKLLRPGMKFRVTARRSAKVGEKTSMELQKSLGEIAFRTGASVDLKNFDVNLEVEVHSEYTYVFHEKFEGPGGFPSGSQGRGLVLFSGGIDSPVAGWLMARKGMNLDFIFVNILGPALESKVKKVFSSLGEWLPGSELFVVDAVKNAESIRSQVREGLRQIVYKRMIYRIAEKFCTERKIPVIITGESLGQVSSQTAKSLACIEKAVNIPVMRPLIGMDKEEITAIAEKIGTYKYSSAIPEFCSMEDHSNASPSGFEVDQEEKNISVDFSGTTARKARNQKFDLEPKERDYEVVLMWKALPVLKKGKKYLFVCKSGNKSAEEAVKARKAGFEAYSIDYRQAKKKGFIED